MRRWVLIGVGLALAGLFGWLTVRKVDWPMAWAAFSSAHWALLVLAIPFLLSSVFFRALRWRLILREHPQARLGALTVAAGIGVGANAVLPGKLGEAVAAHALGRLADLSRIQALGILVITRVVDLLVLFILVLVASFVLPSPALRSVRQAAALVVGVSALLLILPVVFHFRWATNWLAAARGIIQRALGARAMDFAQKFGRGLAGAGQLEPLVVFVLSTALLWLVLSASLFLALRAFEIELAPSWVPLVLGLMAVSATLPSAPGNVGTFHYFGVLALGLAGVRPGLAAACIITYHALDMVSALALGAVCGVIARTPLAAWRTARPEVLVTTSAPAAEAVGSALLLSGDAAPPGPRQGAQPMVAAEDV